MVPEPNCHTINVFSENLLAIEMKRTQILTNKPVYLDLSTLEISQIVMYKFWYDYVKLKYGEKSEIMLYGTDSFIVIKKT